MLSNENFFDNVSEFYDDMISFDAALVNRKKALSSFITSDMHTAADLGCGTGLDTISLSSNGLQVTSFDNSEGMLEKAKAKADKLGLNISFRKVSIAEIPDEHFNKYDLVVSLGNTIANVTSVELPKTINNIHKLLKPGGTVLIQILNYKPIAAKGERILNITQNNEKYFIRFYDFYTDHLKFNILTFAKDNPANRELSETLLYPHSSDALTQHLNDMNFRDINLYGNFNKAPFDKDTSKDLVLMAVKA